MLAGRGRLPATGVAARCECWSRATSIAFTPAAVVLAQTFVAAPHVVRAARAGFASVARDLGETAALDGASGVSMLRFVVLPAAGFAMGAATRWSRAMG